MRLCYKHPATSIVRFGLALTFTTTLTFTSWAEGLLPLPSPDLAAMEPAVRLRIEVLQTAVADALRTSSGREAEASEAARLSTAFGELGKHYLANELMDASGVAFANAWTLVPGDFRWPYYLGVVQQSTGDVENAARSFLKTLELKPDDLASLVRLGDVLMELDRTAEAEARYQQVLALDPASAAAHYGLGNVAAAKEDHAAAVRRFEKALELEAGASIIHYPLGQAYRKLGELDKARQHLQQRGEERVTFPDPLGSEVAWLNVAMAITVVEGMASRRDDFSERNFLGFVLSQLGEVAGVIEHLQEALRAAGVDMQARPPATEDAAHQRRVLGRMHYAVGGLLVHQGADAKAQAHFESARELAPELLDAHIKLGNLKARAGRLDDAIAAYSEVLAADGSNAPALLNRAAARMDQGQDALAIVDLVRLLELEPAQSEPRLRLARAYERTGDTANARQQYLAALELDLAIGEQALTHYHLGELARKTGDPADAVERYQAAVDLDAELTDAHFQLATTLGRLRRFDDAAARYRQLIERQPQHLRARLGEVTALSLLGRFADARDRLDSGLEAMPESLELTYTLARLLASCPDRAVRDGERAIELAQAAVATAPSLEHAETLAMALAEAGRFEDATELQRGLIAQAETKGQAKALPRLRKHLGLYQGYQACCGDGGAN